MAGVLSPEEIAFQQANISQNKGSLVVGLSIALTVIPAIAVVLRFAARHVQKLPFKTDDWLTIPALVSDEAISKRGAVLIPPCPGHDHLNVCNEHSFRSIWLGKAFNCDRPNTRI